MPSALRAFDEGTRRADRQLRELGDELRERRLTLGFSQAHVAAAARMSRSRYSRIEAGKVPTFAIVELNRVASVLGLRTSVRLYPGGAAVRDAGQAGKLEKLLGFVVPPLSFRVEMPVSPSDPRDLRAWDAMLFGAGERTAIELEMRVRDVQAMRRRSDLKRRDNPPEHFLLLIADTRANRRVLDEFRALFHDLPRLRPSQVIQALRRGEHPGTGMVLM